MPGKVTGILACDPSWRGMAFTIYIPSLNYSNCYLFDLKDYSDSERFKQPKLTIEALVKVVGRLRSRECRLSLVDKVIIENQYKQNMKTLSLLLSAVIQSKVRGCKVEYLSALTCKRNYGICLESTHNKNKQRMFEYVTGHKDELIGAPFVTDHNTADSCIILNTWLAQRNRKLNTCLDDYCTMSKSPLLICPKCNDATGALKQCGENAKPENRGKWFLTCNECKNFKMLTRAKPKYGNTGYSGWKLAEEQDSGYDTVEIDEEQEAPRQRKRSRPIELDDDIPSPKKSSVAVSRPSSLQSKATTEQLNSLTERMRVSEASIRSINEFKREIIQRLRAIYDTLKSIEQKPVIEEGEITEPLSQSNVDLEGF